jgi:S-adenosylmethionine synthetase
MPCKPISHVQAKGKEDQIAGGKKKTRRAGKKVLKPISIRVCSRMLTDADGQAFVYLPTTRIYTLRYMRA